MQSLYRYEFESRTFCLANFGKPDTIFISELSSWTEMGCFICFRSARKKHSNLYWSLDIKTLSYMYMYLNLCSKTWKEFLKRPPCNDSHWQYTYQSEWVISSVWMAISIDCHNQWTRRCEFPSPCHLHWGTFSDKPCSHCTCERCVNINIRTHSSQGIKATRQPSLNTQTHSTESIWNGNLKSGNTRNTTRNT